MKYVKILATVAIIILATSAITYNFCTYKNVEEADDQVKIDIGQTGDVFTIDYKTDYKLRDYMEQGGADISGILNFLTENVCEGHNPLPLMKDFGCSSFIIKNQDNDDILARNFDLSICVPCVVTTHPSDGYSSISVSTLEFFGYEGQTLQEMRENDYTFRGVAYIPLDGMNEKGLTVSVNVVHNTEGLHQNSGKTSIFTVAIQRIILDYASSIEEAKHLISQFDLVHSFLSNYHMMITDASGRAVEAEFGDDCVKFTETNKVTNHFLDPELGKDVEVTESSMHRMAVLTAALEGREYMSDSEILDTIASVACLEDPIEHYTQWTSIYNKDAKTLTLYIMADYTVKYDFALA